ncbi:hypothetical protein ACFFX1_54740 [Dactylosporangium sucinum]|uniref:ASCH domain-containing protein n=1 Tax=Dactylosporangium sucinum TaxID=1424081 RepID=A0A917U2T2_9ACTN|nr:hypothetical protein [Dactylosporangium sucinum]GGM53680.1 hypothetical protein GCM10007977_064100 [Dactylosporangium sucinum]
MKAITIRPPWVHAITEPPLHRASGAGFPKRTENRGRPTTYRGEIAIHAGATWCKAGLADGRVQRYLHGTWVDAAAAGFLALGLTVGAVLAVADLVDCHQAAPVDAAGETCCFPWGEPWHAPGRPAFHLVLDNVRRFDEPVRTAGQLAVPWTLPADVEDAVRAQLRRAAS